MSASATLKVRVQIVPCEGFTICRVAPGKYGVIARDDASKSVTVEAQAVSRVFESHINGELADDHFNDGFGTYWRVAEVVEV